MKRKESSLGTVWVLYAATVAFGLLFSLMPSGRVWGLNWYRYFSWYGPLILIVVAAMFPLLLNRTSWRGVSRDPQEGRGRFWPWGTAVIIISLAAWVALSARTHFLGDGLQLLARIEAGAVPIRPWNIGAYFLIDTVYAWLGGQGASQAQWAFRLVAYASGLLFLALAAYASVKLFAQRRHRLLFLIGMATGGYALLFFGYVENYSPFVMLIGAATFCGLLAAREKISRWWILVPTVLAPLIHPYAVALVPGAVYILLRGSGMSCRVGCWSRSTKRLLLSILGAATIGGFLWAYHSSLFLQLSLVPIWHNRFTVEGYTLFSVKHLLDLLNLLWMLFPGLALLIWLALSARISELIRRPAYIFLMLLLGSSLGIVFMFDPKLGMPRDWDLFAFAGIPLVVLCYYALLDEEINLHGRETAAAAAVALGLFFLLPRAVTQAIPDTSIAVFDSYTELDPIRTQTGRYVLLQYMRDQGQSREAARRELVNARVAPYEGWDSNGQELLKQGKIKEAEVQFRRAVAYAPSYSYSWANLGLCFVKRSKLDSALVYLRIADGLNPFNSDNYNALGYVYLQLGDSAIGEDRCREAIRLNPRNFTARGNLIQLYKQQDRQDDLIQLLADVINVDSLPYGVLLESAGQLLEIEATDAASRVCRHALKLDPHSRLPDDLKERHPWFEPVLTEP